MEDSGLAVDEINPVWRLLSPEYENYPNISTARKPSFYLPGWASPLDSGLDSHFTFQNLPGSDFFRHALISVYGESTLGFSVPGIMVGGLVPSINYSGYSSVALL